MSESRIIPNAIVVLIALAATLPFLNKAYHIDDVLYLTVAQQIIKNPLNPFGDPVKDVVMWDSPKGEPDSLFNTDFNPPLWKYVLAVTIKYWGAEEWKTHSVVAVVVVLASLGLYHVSRRLTAWPTWCVAMIVLSPFYMPGQNCMLEPLVLCLVAWGTYFQFRAWETRSIQPALIAGISLGLAVLTKYSAGLLLPLFIVGCFLFEAPTSESKRGLLFARVSDFPRSLLFIVPAAMLIGLWCLHNIIYYHQIHLTSHGVVFKPEEWIGKGLTVLRTVGAVSFFGPIWWVQLWKRGSLGIYALIMIVVVSAIAGWIDAALISRVYGNALLPILSAQVFWFTGLGMATLLGIAASSWMDFRLDRRLWWSASTDRFLEMWIAAFLVFNVACTPFNAVRHMLLVFLPMTWLTARRMPLRWHRLPMSILGVSTALAFLLAAADYELANAYRDIAQQNIRRDIAAGRKVWITGNWGFVYYAMAEGAKPLFIGTEDFGWGRPAPGDRIYHPYLLNWRRLDTTGKEWVEHLQPEGIFPLRPVAPGAHFYGMLTYLLPWEFLLIPSPIEKDEAGENDQNVKSLKEGEKLIGYQFPPLDHVQIFDVKQPQLTRSPWE